MNKTFILVSLFILVVSSLFAQQKRTDNPDKIDVRRLDSFYTNFANNQKSNRMNEGKRVVEELTRQQFKVDSLLLGQFAFDSGI